MNFGEFEFRVITECGLHFLPKVGAKKVGILICCKTPVNRTFLNDIFCNYIDNIRNTNILWQTYFNRFEKQLLCFIENSDNKICDILEKLSVSEKFKYLFGGYIHQNPINIQITDNLDNVEKKEKIIANHPSKKHSKEMENPSPRKTEVFAIAEFQNDKLAIAEEVEDEPGNKNNETNLSYPNTSISFDEKLRQINSVIEDKNPQRNIKIDESHVCRYCGKKMKSKLYLKTHELRIHENVNIKSFPCQLCEKVFHFKNKLKKHQSNKHENHRPVVCDVCGKTFYVNADLMRHQRRTHEKHKPCVCDICGKGFTQKSHLDKHKVIHTGERNYPCKEEGCGKSFKQRWHLVQHERLHTGVKPYQCKYCEVKFRQKSSLDSHIKIHNK